MIMQNAAGFFEAYDQAYNNSIHDNIVINAYGQQCYDATWTLARALNRTMTGELYNYYSSYSPY